MRKYILWITAAALMLILAACGSNDTNSNADEKGEEAASDGDEKVIEHLGEEYTIPANTDKIVIVGAIEAMEDAQVLDVKPIGASTTGGEFPEIFASTVLSDAEPIGEKTEPNVEAILELDPDVILMSTKFPEETVEKVEKVAQAIPYSHIAADWQDNLQTLAAITGKESEAEAAIEAYETHLEEAKTDFEETDMEEDILTLRVRNGDLFIYPEDVFMNAMLYGDLGFAAPDVVQAAEAQEQLPLEKLSEVDPDHIFLQYETSSNEDDDSALEELENNPIWQSLTAVKDDHVYVNVIDPILEGGPLYSREALLDATLENVKE